jgi:hypothetical protein
MQEFYIMSFSELWIMAHPMKCLSEGINACPKRDNIKVMDRDTLIPEWLQTLGITHYPLKGLDEIFLCLRIANLRYMLMYKFYGELTC